MLPLSSLAIQRRLRAGLLLGFSGLREDELESGVKALVKALGK